MEKQQEKNVEKTNYAIYAAIGLLVIAIAWAFFAMQPPAQAAQTDAAAEFFFASMGKMANQTSYAYEFVEEADGLESGYKVAVAGGDRFISASNILGEWEFYSSQEGFFACGEFNNASECARVRKNSSIEKRYVQDMEPEFISAQQVRADAQYVKELMQYGAVLFEENMLPKEADGENCTQIAYAINYRKLSLDQLAQLGIAANSPLLTQFGDYRVELCIEEKSGIPLRVGLSYKYNGEQMGYAREYGNFRLENVIVPAPKNIGSTVKLEEIFMLSDAEAEVYGQCEELGAAGRDACYKSIAIGRNDEYFCSKIAGAQDAARCYLTVGANLGQVRICEKAGEFMYDCFFEIGARHGDVQACERILNESARQQCKGFAANVTVQVPVNNTGALPVNNCVADSECAPTGCSGTVCAPANESVMTTCEYQPVYACFKKALCGCKAGTCAWYKGEEYYACVSDVERAQTEEYIKNLTTDEEG